MPEFEHRPVMGREVVELLAPVPSGLVVDATVGGGGHARLLLEARHDLRLLGIDRDPDAVTAARDALARFGARARVVQGGFEDLAGIVEHRTRGEHRGDPVRPGREQPAARPEPSAASPTGPTRPLDMRMDSAQELTAADVVNTYAEDDLAAIIAGNGEERFARRIARAIVAARPLRTTGELVDAIKTGIPAPARRRGRHPARRTFQAIRMEVNRELPNLAAGLDESVHLLDPGRAHARPRVPLARGPPGEASASPPGQDATTAEPPGMPVTRSRNPLVRLLTRRPAPARRR